MSIRKSFGACLAVLAISVLASSCSKKEEKIDLGTLTGPLYKNDYFRLTVKIPETWQVQDNETKKKLMAQGSKVVAGENIKLKDTLDASALDSVNLLTVFQYPMGASVSYNPAFLLMADKIVQYPGINRGSDYLLSARAIMESSKMIASFVGGISSEGVGGVSFDTMVAQIKTPTLLVTQKYYATIKKGYALVIIVSYSTDKELQALNSFVQSIRFQ